MYKKRANYCSRLIFYHTKFNWISAYTVYGVCSNTDLRMWFSKHFKIVWNCRNSMIFIPNKLISLGEWDMLRKWLRDCSILYYWWCNHHPGILLFRIPKPEYARWKWVWIGFQFCFFGCPFVRIVKLRIKMNTKVEPVVLFCVHRPHRITTGGEILLNDSVLSHYKPLVQNNTIVDLHVCVDVSVHLYYLGLCRYIYVGVLIYVGGGKIDQRRKINWQWPDLVFLIGMPNIRQFEIFHQYRNEWEEVVGTLNICLSLNQIISINFWSPIVTMDSTIFYVCWSSPRFLLQIQVPNDRPVRNECNLNCLLFSPFLKRYGTGEYSHIYAKLNLKY